MCRLLPCPFWMGAMMLTSAAGEAVLAGLPLSSAFTFQGRLLDAGQSANGTFSMDFRLFDADATLPGVQIGGVISLSVQVTDGLFTVELNDADQFGASAFNGDERWLEVTVNGNTLTPRQLVTAAPYAQTAIEALSVAGIDGHSLDAADGAPFDAVFVSEDGNVGIGTTTPMDRLHIAGGGLLLPTGFGLNKLDSGGVARALMTYDGSDNAQLFAPPDKLLGFRTGTGGFTSVRATLTPTGRFGINTTAPDALLHVQAGDVGSASVITATNLMLERNSDNWLSFMSPTNRLSGLAFGRPGATATELFHGAILYNDATQADAMQFRTGGNATRMTIDSAGAVGIGTTAPGMELDVRSTASSAAGQVRAGNSNADTWLMLWSGFTNGSNDPAIIWSDDVAGDDLRFLTSSTGGTGGGEHMRITGAGNVGIGTTSPQAPLHVVGEVRAQGVGNRFASRNPDNTSAIFQLDWYDHPTDPLQNVARLRLGGSGDGAGGGIAFQGGGDVEWMRVTGAGDVGIGTAAPEAPLHVFDNDDITAGGGGSLIIGDPATFSLRLDANEIQAFGNGVTNDLALQAVGGNVGIGTTAPTGKLHVAGASGNASVVLPSSSISAAETLDESGVANGRTDPDAFFPFGTSVFAVTSRTINCPAGGHVLVLGTVNLNALSDTLVWVGVSDSATTFPEGQKKYQTILGTRWETVTVQGLFAVVAGNNTFYLLVKDIEDNTDNFAGNAHLTLMYLPTTYGTVEPD